MSKVMMTNGQMAIVTGVVKSVKDDAEKLSVALEYQGYDAVRKASEPKVSYIYFYNQDRRDDGREPILYAEKARRMRLREGSSVIAYVRFTDDEKKNAYGYGIKYDGVMSIRTGEGEEQKTYSCVKGLVTRLTRKQDSKGNDFLSVSVYTGKDKDGNFVSESVQVRNTRRNANLVANAEKVLSPRNDGTKLAACFTCGAPYEAYNGEGDAYNIYTAFDFDVTGLKAVDQ